MNKKIKFIPCRYAAIHSTQKQPDCDFCDFLYFEAVFASDLPEQAKYLFCKYFSNHGVRHGYQITLLEPLIKEEISSLELLSAKGFLSEWKITHHSNVTEISFCRPYWPEMLADPDIETA